MPGRRRTGADHGRNARDDAIVTTRLVIFAVTYVLIAVQQLPGVRLNRPAASLLGAVAMVAIGGLPVRNADDLVRIVAERFSPGDAATFTLIRDGKRQELRVVLGERPLD